MRDSFAAQGWQGALVLGGGYGRGEGGVMPGPAGVCFSNDLDYFMFDEAPGTPRLVAWCRQLERAESEALGIDVEIKCLRADSLGDPSRSMMFADLVAGHVVVAGMAGFLAQLREGLDFSRIEPEEATRLLWNRGSGLFFSRCRMGLAEGLPFVIRNHAKLKLALGDAWLCLHGQYTSKCRERAERLATADLPAALARLRQWHAEGVAFKFDPFADGLTWPQLAAESRQLGEAWGDLYLVIEARRLQRRLAGFAEYLALPRLLPGTPLTKNLALAMRDKFKRGGFLRPLGDYPRASLMRALPCLLELTPGGVAEAGRFLPPPSGDPARLQTWEGVYSKWWAHYA
ncbi:MAG: hypothetical protein NTW21_32580 [Verrucomicrobia bacterium]|nr:hypothetical protein [Verrucomicrobiota bacterium]